MKNAGALTGFEDPKECSRCGTGAVRSRVDVITFDYHAAGEPPVNLSAELAVQQCAHCGYEFASRTVDEAKHAAICRHLGVLTPSEVRILRGRYEMTRMEFCRITRIGEASLARWESGAVIQNDALDQYLFLLTYPENMKRLDGRLKSRRLRDTSLQENSSRFSQLAEDGLLQETLDQAPKFELRRGS